MDRASLNLPAAYRDHFAVATSGTTGGRKKWALLSRDAIRASADAVNRHLGATSRDRWLLALPTDHVGGMGVVARAERLGNPMFRLGKWSATEFHSLSHLAGVTLSAIVPTQLHDLVAREMEAPATLRAVVLGGAAVDDGLYARARALGWPVLRSFGMTEASSQIATALADDERLHVLSHFETRAGDDGTLSLRGPALLDAYAFVDDDGKVTIEDPKVDGWLATHDRVALEAGTLRWLGRRDDVVKVGGQAVDLARLNSLLEKGFGTRGEMTRACFVARPDSRLGHAIDLVYENDGESTVRAILDEMIPELAAHERPRSESPLPFLPRTALGKIDRGAIDRQRSL